MAEICLDCLNKVFSNRKPLKEKDVVIDIDLCEDCGEWKPCVVTIKKHWWNRILSAKNHVIKPNFSIITCFNKL